MFDTLGFEGREDRQFLIHENRTKLSIDFIHKLKNHHVEDRYGVLISGPNGVGKSALGLLTMYACMAAGHPVIYVCSAFDWLSDSAFADPEIYILDLFVRQNADIIMSSKILWPVFSKYFRGEEELGASVAYSLKKALRENPSFGLGIIVDEVQAITSEVFYSPTLQSKRTQYFAENWYNWQGGFGSLCVRMDIASSHGMKIVVRCDLCFNCSSLYSSP